MTWQLRSTPRIHSFIHSSLAETEARARGRAGGSQPRTAPSPRRPDFGGTGKQLARGEEGPRPARASTSQAGVSRVPPAATGVRSLQLPVAGSASGPSAPALLPDCGSTSRFGSHSAPPVTPCRRSLVTASHMSRPWSTSSSGLCPAGSRSALDAPHDVPFAVRHICESTRPSEAPRLAPGRRWMALGPFLRLPFAKSKESRI